MPVIIPIAPLTQSTMDKPDGLLTLRVFPDANREGSVYQDDGTSFAYKQGVYFRQHFTCSEVADGAVTVHLDAPEGSFTPWWRALRIEVFGNAAAHHPAESSGKKLKVEAGKSSVFAVIPVSKTATEVVFH